MEDIARDTISATATEEAEHIQESTFERHLRWIRIGCLWVVVGFMLIVGVVCLYHLVTPYAGHFLDREQISLLNTITVSSIVSALLTHFVQGVTR